MKTIIDLLNRVVELTSEYLAAVPQTPGRDGRLWNDSVSLTSGRGGIESVASYVRNALDLPTIHASEQLILAAAAANPDRFVCRFMRNKEGVLVTDKVTGDPIPTIALRGGGSSKPFVPGQTQLPPRQARAVSDATVQTGGAVADPATSESF